MSKKNVYADKIVQEIRDVIKPQLSYLFSSLNKKNGRFKHVLVAIHGNDSRKYLIVPTVKSVTGALSKAVKDMGDIDSVFMTVNPVFSSENLNPQAIINSVIDIDWDIENELIVEVLESIGITDYMILERDSGKGMRKHVFFKVNPIYFLDYETYRYYAIAAHVEELQEEIPDSIIGNKNKALRAYVNIVLPIYRVVNVYLGHKLAGDENVYRRMNPMIRLYGDWDNQYKVSVVKRDTCDLIDDVSVKMAELFGNGYEVNEFLNFISKAYRGLDENLKNGLVYFIWLHYRGMKVGLVEKYSTAVRKKMLDLEYLNKLDYKGIADRLVNTGLVKTTIFVQRDSKSNRKVPVNTILKKAVKKINEEYLYVPGNRNTIIFTLASFGRRYGMKKEKLLELVSDLINCPNETEKASRLKTIDRVYKTNGKLYGFRKLMELLGESFTSWATKNTISVIRKDYNRTYGSVVRDALGYIFFDMVARRYKEGKSLDILNPEFREEAKKYYDSEKIDVIWNSNTRIPKNALKWLEEQGVIKINMEKKVVDHNGYLRKRIIIHVELTELGKKVIESWKRSMMILRTKGDFFVELVHWYFGDEPGLKNWGEVVKDLFGDMLDEYHKLRDRCLEDGDEFAEFRTVAHTLDAVAKIYSPGKKRYSARKLLAMGGFKIPRFSLNRLRGFENILMALVRIKELMKGGILRGLTLQRCIFILIRKLYKDNSFNMKKVKEWFDTYTGYWINFKELKIIMRFIKHINTDYT